MVILPNFLQLCEFAPAVSKRKHTLPLFRYVLLTVLILIQKDHHAHVDLPLFCDFTPVLALSFGHYFDKFQRAFGIKN